MALTTSDLLAGKAHDPTYVQTHGIVDRGRLGIVWLGDLARIVELGELALKHGDPGPAKAVSASAVVAKVKRAAAPYPGGRESLR